jgi:integrase
MTRFTQIGVAKLKAPPKPQRIDKIHTIDRGLGLALRLSYSGSKTWRVLYYVHGQPRTQTLGKFPAVSVAEAYKKVRKFDPEAASKKVETGTFKQVAEDYVLNHVQAEGLRSEKELVRCLTKYVYPAWGSKPFAEIRRREVSELRNEIRNKHGKRQANVVVTILAGLMNWYAINKSEDYITPIIKGMRFKKTEARSRALTHDEIRTVWAACEKPVLGTFGAIVKVLLLTAQRREKVGSMKWQDVVDGVWTIPIEDREKGNAGTLKLPEAVRAIIDAQPVIAGNPYVFAGRSRGQAFTHFHSFSQGKAELDAMAPIAPWTLHDLRRTARSLLAGTDVPRDHAERLLGHVIPGVEGTYNRHGYVEEKAHALKALAGAIDSIMNPRPDNVVDLHARA